jgi:hypothetical protein
MVLTDPGKILKDPTKTARHLIALRAYLSERRTFANYKRIMAEYRDIAQTWSNDRRIIAGVRPYHLLNKRLFNRKAKINRLKEVQKKYILFITGVTPDNSEKKYLGYDFFSMRNLLSNRILEALANEPNELHENLAIIPITPVFQPVHFRINPETEYLEAYHVFEDEIAAVSEYLRLNDRVGFGSVTKSVSDIRDGVLKPGFAQHGMSLYDSADAKSYLEDEDPRRKHKLEELLGPMTDEEFTLLIERSCMLNRHLMAMFFGQLINMLQFPKKHGRTGKKQIDIAASSTSPYFTIIKMATEHYTPNAELTHFSKTFMSNIERPFEREAHPTAIKRIISRINARVIKRAKPDISHLL